MTKSFTALGSMIFAGGFTLGMQSQFEVVGHLENGPFGVGTAQRNLGVPVYTDFQSWPVDSFAGVDVVYSNPPCAPWSICGSSLYKGNDNWRTDKNFEGTRMARTLLTSLRPKMWVQECVCLLLTRGKDYIDQLIDEAGKFGYAVTLFQLDAKLWGLPQQRRRVFVIVHRIDISLDIWRASMPPCVMTTVDQAFEGLTDPGEYKEMSPYYQYLCTKLPEGKWLARAWEDDMGIKPGAWLGTGKRMPGRPRFETHRLRGDLPADSMTGGSDAFIHPHEDRFLGMNELARLCGFPDDYEWPPVKKGSIEMGKGVTPTAARVLAGVLHAALEVGEPAWPGSVTEVDFRAKTGRLACYEPKNEIRRTLPVGVIGGIPTYALKSK